jgi:hypothetical protein
MVEAVEEETTINQLFSSIVIARGLARNQRIWEDWQFSIVS